MRSKIVLTKNVARLSDATETLLRRSPGMPGMGLVHGETGTGKTTAVTWLINRHNGVFVRAMSLWSPSAMLKSILRELGRAPGNACAQMMDDIIEALALSGRPLFVDEADYLVDSKRMSEALRDLHDMSSAPVVLIGMKGIDQRLSSRKQLTGRVLRDVRFEALDAEDAAELARELCEVEVRDDLMDAMLHKVGGYVRNLVVALDHVEDYAKRRGMGVIGLADWGKRDFILGDAPSTPKLRAVKPATETRA